MEPALIAVDIDGVLNPYNMSRSRGQKLGYRPSKRLRQERMMRTFWNRTHGAELRRLSREYDAELVWATYWNGLANEYARLEVGLPELPVVELDLTTLTTDWKYPTMLAYAAGRPLVWFDDEHVDHGRGRDEFLAARTEPTALIDVPPVEGLGEPQIAAAERFLGLL
ncbi:HAD domain-containing protein [Actinomycetospora sp. CA-084318]|uniref:HAD domain-containing protein n=1 Tax=Actinomycetospora sp. CA-084318 TaxID=3239892 RepID=UPI003D956FE9